MKKLTGNLSPEDKQSKIIDLANAPDNKDLLKLKLIFTKGYTPVLEAGKDNQTLVSCYNRDLFRKKVINKK